MGSSKPAQALQSTKNFIDQNTDTVSQGVGGTTGDVLGTVTDPFDPLVSNVQEGYKTYEQQLQLAKAEREVEEEQEGAAAQLMADTQAEEDAQPEGYMGVEGQGVVAMGGRQEQKGRKFTQTGIQGATKLTSQVNTLPNV